jgi:hypothetical protein
MSTGKTALTAVVAAAMDALAVDATLMAAVPGGVWDYVPADPSWPFVCLDSASEEPFDTYGRQGRTVRLTFAVFSDYQGRKEQFAIVDHLVRLLRHVSLDGVGSPDLLTGWEHVVTWHTGSQAVSPFDVGNTRAGSSLVTVEVQVVESAP